MKLLLKIPTSPKKTEIIMYKNFELSSLLAFFDDDKPAVHDYLAVVVDDWTGLKMELIKSVKNKNLKEYRGVVHRMLTPMKLLKMTEIQNLLNNGNGRIELSDEAENKLFFEMLFNKIDDFLNEMKEVLPTMK